MASPTFSTPDGPVTWRDLPSDVGSFYRPLEESGFAEGQWMPLDALVRMLRGHTSFEFAKRFLVSMVERHAKTHALLGVDAQGVARFAPASLTVETITLAATVLLHMDLMNNVGFGRRDARALGAYAEACGARAVDVSAPLEASGWEAFIDLMLAERLMALHGHALRQEEAPLDAVCDTLGIDDLPPDLTTYFSLMEPNGVSFQGFHILGSDAAIATWRQRCAGNAAHRLVPLVNSRAFVLAADVRGAVGAIGVVYACTDDMMAPAYPSVAAMLLHLDTLEAQLAQMAASLPS